MKNKHKNDKIARRVFLTQEIDQDPQINDIYSLIKILAKTNIQHKTTHTTQHLLLTQTLKENLVFSTSLCD
jgi:hypothetical protein